jgi:signal transduction histidine kinase
MLERPHPMPRPAPRGIGFYLVALILIAVVPLVISAVVLVARQSELQREAFEKSLLQTALALSVAVDRQLNTYQVMLETLAQSEDLERGRIQPFHELSARAAAVHGAVFVSLFDRQGKQIFNTLRPPGAKLPTPFRDTPAGQGEEQPPVGDPSWMQQVLDTGRPVTSNLLFGLVAQRLIFVVNVPVLRDGKVVYVLNAGFEPKVMTRLLQENPQFSGVPAVIFDRRGFIVGRWKSADEYVGKRVTSIRDDKMPADSGVSTGTTLEGIPMYFSYARSQVTGWGVNIGTPRSELEAALHASWLTSGLLAAGGLVFGVLFALLLAARLRRSIVGLADAASRSQDPTVPGLRTREIAQLQDVLAESARAREAQAHERESRLIAEARKAEAEEASRMKDRFIAVLSHELRNPLAPVRNSVPLLRALHERQELAPMKNIIEMLDRQSAQLTRLVNDLLDVSRISTGRIELKREALDLGAVARHAIETVAPGTQARRQRLTSELPPHRVEITGDFARLSQIVSNLLDNAVKFTPEGGEIRLSLRVEDGQAVLRVRDTGIGIEPGALPQIFTAFAVRQRLDSHSGAGGLGLGLSLARSLAELHGGSVEARSKGRGQGAEFVLRLPLAAAPAEPQATPSPLPAQGPQFVPRRVLVVDDNVDAASLLGALLTSLGHEAHVVHDGKAALEAAPAFRPQHVLLDISMPGLDGYETARRLRALPGLPPFRILALTGWGQDIDRTRSRAAGFDRHLVKPVDPEELLRALAVG